MWLFFPSLIFQFLSHPRENEQQEILKFQQLQQGKINLKRFKCPLPAPEVTETH